MSAQLTDSFDPKLAKRVGELSPIAQAVTEFEKAKEVGSHSVTRERMCLIAGSC